MKTPSDYSFKAVEFASARKIVHAPVAFAVRPSNNKRVTIRINSATAKRCAFGAREMLTPFVDIEKRAVLLLAGCRPQSDAARPLLPKDGSKTNMEIEFPRCDGMEEIFHLTTMTAVDVRETSQGRLVFVVPKKSEP
jgi:hypothetical protein